MKLEFIGAAHEVTGSCHYLEVGGTRLFVDCGMEQGQKLISCFLPMPTSTTQAFCPLYTPGASGEG